MAHCMLLTGTHDRTLDDKKRLALPKRVREQLGDIKKLFVSQGLDQCLWLFGAGELDRLAEKIDQAPAAHGKVRVFSRLLFSSMEEVELDRNGRILIPERLVQFAGLSHDVALIGVRDHLELWDKVRWQQYQDQHAASFDSVAEEAFKT
jgi:transcriptional regulator MraZ